MNEWADQLCTATNPQFATGMAVDDLADIIDRINGRPTIRELEGLVQRREAESESATDGRRERKRSNWPSITNTAAILTGRSDLAKLAKEEESPKGLRACIDAVFHIGDDDLIRFAKYGPAKFELLKANLVDELGNTGALGLGIKGFKSACKFFAEQREAI